MEDRSGTIGDDPRLPRPAEPKLSVPLSVLREWAAGQLARARIDAGLASTDRGKGIGIGRRDLARDLLARCSDGKWGSDA